MSILEEAEEYKFKNILTKTMGLTKEAGYPDKDLGFYELLRYFDITSIEKMRDPETLRKVDIIYEFLKDSENIMQAARELSSKLGNPVELIEKMNKMYSHVYSLNLEKGFEKQRVAGDEQLKKDIDEKRKKSEELKTEQRSLKRKESITRKEREEGVRLDKTRSQRIKSQKNQSSSIILIG